MKRTKIFLIMAALLLTGCNTIDDATGDNCRKPVLLTASGSDVVSTQIGMRSADGLYESSTGFDGGEQVQLYLHNSAYPTTILSGIYDVGTPDDNHKSELTYAGGTELLYPVEQTNSGSPTFTLYGVYPAESMASHTVKYDQTNTSFGEYMYKFSDLMYASTALTWTSAADKDNARNLRFDHQLAKLKLTIVKASEISQVNAVRIVNTKRKVSVTPAYSGLTLGTPATATDDENGDYILLSEGEEASDAQQTYTYCCVFVPNTWTDAAFIEVEADGGTATFRTTKTFTGGKEYQLTLNLTPTALNTTATIDNWLEGDFLGTLTEGRLHLSAVSDYSYTGNPCEPEPTVTMTSGGTTVTLTKDTDFDLLYFNNINAGTATVIAVGKAGTDYEGEIGMKYFTINKRATTLTCDNTALSFSASEKTNSTKTKTGVSCTDGTISVSSSDATKCTVSYSSGTVTVTRKTDDAFSVTITVSVTPTNTTNYSASNVTFTVRGDKPHSSGDVILDPDDNNYIKVYTSETEGYKISTTNSGSGPWKNDQTIGTAAMWNSVFYYVGGTGYSGLNTKAAYIWQWTAMSGSYWTCSLYQSVEGRYFTNSDWSSSANSETRNYRTIYTFNDNE